MPKFGQNDFLPLRNDSQDLGNPPAEFEIADAQRVHHGAELVVWSIDDGCYVNKFLGC